MPVSAKWPGAFETWLCGFARDAAIEREAPERESPVAAIPGEPRSGWCCSTAANRAGCHGTPDAKETGSGFRSTCRRVPFSDGEGALPGSDGEFFVVARRIRFTAMPTFAHILKEEDLWKLVVFLKHLDDLRPEVRK
jgi:hypothetical protein